MKLLGLLPFLLLGSPQGKPPSTKVATKYFPGGAIKETFEYYLSKTPSGLKADTVYSGVRMLWDSLGRKDSMEKYKAGKLDGESLDWFKSGVMRRSLYYHSGKLDSETFRDETGRTTQRIHHVNKKDTIFYYDKDGTMTIQDGYFGSD